ncbi:vegetative cell wall protein gp1-like [Spodoptera litura]|uniref:Vegetative cell wall protein gp1-like n=1 Tax=Spodoptera litura TaxID=69820 RepID=A0A9J7J377_SPOLT|nr:vegetative cell wall protein gp1-like [Spodoptera litura]
MPHGGREPPASPRSSKPSKGKGRIFKNSKLQPSEIRALQAVARQYNAAASQTSTPTGGTSGAGEEFFPPPPSIPDTPASPSPPPRATRPNWSAPPVVNMPEPMDVVAPHLNTTDRDTGSSHPTTAIPDAGTTHPPSAIPRPTPRPQKNTAQSQPATAATAAPRDPTTTPVTPETRPPAGTQHASAPPRQQRPKKPQQGPTTARAAPLSAAPTRAADPSAAPSRTATGAPAPLYNTTPGHFPSPTREPADKRQAVFITPPFRPPPILPPFTAPPQHDTAPPPTYAAAAAPNPAGTRAPASAAGHTATPTTTNAATNNTSAPAPGPQSAPAPKTRYPPLIVEKLPNWVEHFAALRRRMGHAPNARPFGQGVRFTPRSDEEYRAIQAYLADLERTQGVAWFSYSLPAERSLKVAIRGLPVDTPPEAIQEALRDAGYKAEYVRPIRARQGRPGCL